MSNDHEGDVVHVMGGKEGSLTNARIEDEFFCNRETPWSPDEDDAVVFHEHVHLNKDVWTCLFCGVTSEEPDAVIVERVMQ